MFQAATAARCSWTKSQYEPGDAGEAYRVLQEGKVRRWEATRKWM